MSPAPRKQTATLHETPSAAAGGFFLTDVEIAPPKGRSPVAAISSTLNVSSVSPVNALTPLKDFSTMSYGFKATQPLTEMFCQDFSKVENQTSRAKSITMLKYNDVKQR